MPFDLSNFESQAASDRIAHHVDDASSATNLDSLHEGYDLLNFGGSDETLHQPANGPISLLEVMVTDSSNLSSVVEDQHSQSQSQLQGFPRRSTYGREAVSNLNQPGQYGQPSHSQHQAQQPQARYPPRYY